MAKFTCEFAIQRMKDGYPGKVTCVTKSNLFLETDVLFEETIANEVKKHPELTYEHYLVDNMNRLMLIRPRDFDVIVAINEYGDILTDAAAEVGGGLGLMGTGGFGGKVPYFESAHGAAPDIAGKNIANPTATVFAAKYMLDYLGMKEEASSLEKAIAAVYKQGDSLTPDQGGTATTKELTEAILKKIR
jgi:isocitrate/isopropylmalate dehydrogenase